MSSTIAALMQVSFGKLYEIEPTLIFDIASFLAIIGAIYLTFKRGGTLLRTRVNGK